MGRRRLTGTHRKREKLTARRKQLVQETGRKRRRQKQAHESEAQREAKRVRGEAEKARHLVRPDHRTLLVGEGNFSFTRALVRGWERDQRTREDEPEDVEDLVGFRVVATCYDSKEDLVAKYPDVKDIVREIKASGVTVHTGIDATKLLQSKRLVRSLAELCESEAQTFQDDNVEEAEDQEAEEDADAAEASSGEEAAEADGSAKQTNKQQPKTVAASVGFDRILFNFPHLGCGITDTEKNNQMHREFLAEFFASAHTVLAAQGQVHVTIKSGEPYDSWRIAQVAVNTGLFKVHSQLAFEPSVYDGYEHRRTLGAGAGGDAEANSDITKMPARTFVFMKADATSARAKRRAVSREKREMRRKAAIQAGDTQAMEMYEMNEEDEDDGAQAEGDDNDQDQGDASPSVDGEAVENVAEQADEEDEKPAFAVKKVAKKRKGSKAGGTKKRR